MDFFYGQKKDGARPKLDQIEKFIEPAAASTALNQN